MRDSASLSVRLRRDAALADSHLMVALFWAERTVALSDLVADLYVLSSILYDLGHYERVVAFLRREERCRSSIACRLLLNRALVALGCLDDALADSDIALNSAITISDAVSPPDSVDPATALNLRQSALWTLRGNIFLSKFLPSDAVSCFSRALALDPTALDAFATICRFSLASITEETNIAKSCYRTFLATKSVSKLPRRSTRLTDFDEPDNGFSSLIMHLFRILMSKYDFAIPTPKLTKSNFSISVPTRIDFSFGSWPTLAESFQVFENMGLGNSRIVLLANAEMLLARGSCYDALFQLLELYSRDPFDFKVLELLIPLLKDEHAPKLATIAHALQSSLPGSSLANFAAGFVVLNKKLNAADACSCFRVVIENDSTFFPALFAYGYAACYIRDDFSQTMAVLDFASKLLPNSPVPTLLAARFAFASLKFSVSHSLLLKLLKIFPEYHIAHLELGLTLIELGKYEKACQSLSCALNLKLDKMLLAECYYGLAKAKYHLENLDDATKFFKLCWPTAQAFRAGSRPADYKKLAKNLKKSNCE